MFEGLRTVGYRVEDIDAGRGWYTEFDRAWASVLGLLAGHLGSVQTA